MSPTRRATTVSLGLLMATLGLTSCSGDDPQVSAPSAAPSQSATLPPAPAPPTHQPTHRPTHRPTHLGRLAGDVFTTHGSGSATFAVTLRRPVELRFTCIDSPHVVLRSSVTGLSGACDGPSPLRTFENVRSPSYPKRVVFRVRSPQPVRWRFALDSHLIAFQGS